MLVRLLGLLLILAGLGLSYFSCRSSNKIQEIEDEEEWEDAVYGGAGDLRFYSMVLGGGDDTVRRLVATEGPVAERDYMRDKQSLKRSVDPAKDNLQQ
jgi:hypothetical protein